MQFQSVHTYEVAVVMPAFRAAETIEATVARLPANSVQHLIVTDDASDDDLRTVVDRMRMEGRTIQFHEHPENRGYGGNQRRPAIRVHFSPALT